MSNNRKVDFGDITKLLESKPDLLERYRTDESFKTLVDDLATNDTNPDLLQMANNVVFNVMKMCRILDEMSPNLAIAGIVKSLIVALSASKQCAFGLGCAIRDAQGSEEDVGVSISLFKALMDTADLLSNAVSDEFVKQVGETVARKDSAGWHMTEDEQTSTSLIFSRILKS